MPKTDSAQTLLKRLQKIERAQGRLGDITARIRLQAETLAELLIVAQAFANDKASKPAGNARSATSSKKTATPQRSARKATAARANAPRSTTTRSAASPKATPATSKRRIARRAPSA
ncbi:MAG: hypothetical protein M3Z57_02085 [Candidatus Dormibacteraeota bacterium]|nr:hypothetical protein [Candidatus Dormibacteraeota bacterium]